MSTALSFLNDLAQWLGRWVPRLVLIEVTHLGVLFGPRGTARLVGAGLRTYWPIAQNLLLVPITTQSVQLYSQILPAAQNPADIVPRVRLVSTAIQYRIADPLAFATKALSPHALIDNRTAAAVARHVREDGDLQAWSAAVLSDVRREVEPFGWRSSASTSRDSRSALPSRTCRTGPTTTTPLGRGRRDDDRPLLLFWLASTDGSVAKGRLLCAARARIDVAQQETLSVVRTAATTGCHR
jgi:hypothetical protein